VARGRLKEDQLYYAGKDAQGNFVNEFPFPVTRPVLARGQERFNVYCAPCHDRLGNGLGMIVRRGYRRPPSYHIDRLRSVANAYIYDVITNGFGAMPDYAAQIAPGDRWAIVAYIRALQRSANATAKDVPPDALAKLNREGGAR
jgi:mono/diheme cytochrome c family protein